MKRVICHLSFVICFCAAAFADAPPPSLPSSTNPQVRQVVERIGQKLDVVEKAQAKTDDLLSVQGRAIATLDKAITTQSDYAANRDRAAKEFEEKYEKARKGKWKFGFIFGAFGAVAGVLLGVMFRPPGGVVVTSPPPSLPEAITRQSPATDQITARKPRPASKSRPTSKKR